MAALKAVCFSPPLSSSLLYATLCVRHRLLLNATSYQRSTFINFPGWTKGQQLSSKVRDNDEIPDKNKNSFIEENELPSVKIDYFNELNYPLDSFDSKLRIMDSVYLSEDNHAIVSPDLVKPRGSQLRQENKDMLFERLPVPKKSNLKFTIGRKTTTLKKAKSVVKRIRKSENISTEEDELDVILQSGNSVKRGGGGQSENSREVLEYLASHPSMYKKDQELYSDALPSIFGANASEIEEISQKLSEVGFTAEEIGRILPIFPHIFELDYNNVFESFCLLRQYLRKTPRVFKLVRKHPALLTSDPSKVSGV